jgi:hypothetical protein
MRKQKQTRWVLERVAERDYRGIRGQIIGAYNQRCVLGWNKCRCKSPVTGYHGRGCYGPAGRVWPNHICPHWPVYREARL